MASPDPERSPLALLDPERRTAVLELDTWQRAEIEAGLREAEAGDFADPDEVAAVFSPRECCAWNAVGRDAL